MPRVRITSGLRGSNGRLSVSGSPNISARSPITTMSQSPFTASQPSSLASTRSSSISSSISAPIRFREQESVPSKWGPLGRRVSMFASSKRKRRSLSGVKSAWDSYTTPQDVGANPSRGREVGDRDERTPLMRNEDNEVDREEVYDINQEIDAIFGKWPRRLLNRHWWWWQVEPFVCCWWCNNNEVVFE
ncbi:hypothetical protein L218DRAFT_729123 [Marasmius fiardii PR-910]|nr:hypothetical protein L218DRAFT_729123 [Marasmius fiardii PR-910]